MVTTPFYQKALALFTRTQSNQIKKGLAKYPEPFNPHNWTPEELLNHALEETVDLTHYLVGLKELLDAKDKEIEGLYTKLSKAQDDIAGLKGIDIIPHKERGKKLYKKEKVTTLTCDAVETGSADGYKTFDYGPIITKKTVIKEQYDLNFNPIPPYFDADDQ